MTNETNWRALFIDDEQEICRQVKEFLEGTVVDVDGHLHVETHNDFNEALSLLETQRFDLVILDVRLGSHDEAAKQEEAGTRTLEAIRQRRFVPIVFYTGLPHLVRHLETSLIRVIEKGSSPVPLLEAVKSIFATRLPNVNRALIRHLETVQRDYMWGFVAEHWEQFGDTPDRVSLAYLLARRLALHLSGQGIQQLAQELGDPSAPMIANGLIHPMRYYVMPPIESAPLAGDLYEGQVGNRDGYWVLLTPSCDLVIGRERAEFVLVARCVSLTEQEEYKKWQSQLPKPSETSTDNLELLLKNNRSKQPERFYFLPAALMLPDLVVDLQQLETLPRNQINSLKRLASLDSPFAEALLARFSRFFGRLGTPDLDPEVVITKLKSPLRRSK